MEATHLLKGSGAVAMDRPLGYPNNADSGFGFRDFWYGGGLSAPALEDAKEAWGGFVRAAVVSDRSTAAFGPKLVSTVCDVVASPAPQGRFSRQLLATGHNQQRDSWRSSSFWGRSPI